MYTCLAAFSIHFWVHKYESSTQPSIVFMLWRDGSKEMIILARGGGRDMYYSLFVKLMINCSHSGWSTAFYRYEITRGDPLKMAKIGELSLHVWKKSVNTHTGYLRKHPPPEFSSDT